MRRIRNSFYRAFAAALVAALMMTVNSSAQAQEEARKNTKDVLVWMRIIDKVAGAPHTLKTSVGVVANYQTLSVLARRCSVNEDGEFAALIEVYHQPPGGGTVELFSGWMFSASPSLTYIEHPFYDVSLVKCAPRKTKAESKQPENPS